MVNRLCFLAFEPAQRSLGNSALRPMHSLLIFHYLTRPGSPVSGEPG
jgi:hypothetical protein